MYEHEIPAPEREPSVGTEAPSSRRTVVEVFTELLSLAKGFDEAYLKALAILGGVNGLALAGVLTALKDAQTNPALMSPAKSAVTAFALGLSLSAVAYFLAILGVKADRHQVVATTRPP